jgi:hypothetical protein
MTNAGLKKPILPTEVITMSEENRCSQCGAPLPAGPEAAQPNPMEKHVALVAVINIVFGAIGILVGLFLFVVLVFGGLASGEPEAMAITSVLGTTLCGFFLILSVPEVIGGVGLLRRRNWARILVLIISVLDLINIPVGTVIGVYSLWVLLNDRTPELFKNTGA